MSAIAGIWHLDGRRVDVAQLRRMNDALAHRGPDSAGESVDETVGFCVRGLHTTPQSLLTRQPFADPQAQLLVALDGRLDNGDDLCRLLDLRRINAVDDVEILARAYQRWGPACAARLLGDFAFAVWDAGERQLCLGRDILGIKPLCYRLEPTTFSWASEMHALVREPGTSREPNEGMVAEYLSRRITDTQETLFKGVYRVPPAHTLVVRDGARRLRRYWTIEDAPPIRHGTDADYAEHLRTTVRDAVRCRLRASGPVGVLLSGGLDSSSIVGVAHELCRDNQAACSGLETFSLIVPGQPDEREYFEAVCAARGRPGHTVEAVLPSIAWSADEVLRFLDVPISPNATAAAPLRSLVQARGIRVLLTGVGGDEWLGSSTWQYADLLRSGRLLALARTIGDDAALEDFPGFPSVLKAAVWPLVPVGAQTLIRHGLGRPRPPAWIRPDFARRVDLTARLERHRASERFATFELQDSWHESASGWATHGTELLDRSGAQYGIEHRHPFHDRRIVEFGFGVPVEQRYRRGQQKHVLRRAMASVLPTTVAQRLTSPNYSQVIVDALEAAGGESAFEGTTIESLGWIDGATTRRMVGAMRRTAGTSAAAVHAWNLWMVYAVEQWLNVAVVGAAREQSRVPAFAGANHEKQQK